MSPVRLELMAEVSEVAAEDATAAAVVVVDQEALQLLMVRVAVDAIQGVELVVELPPQDRQVVQDTIFFHGATSLLE
jgi:hypothetical protein